MRNLALLLVCLQLAGCAASAVNAVPSKVQRPSARLMQTPAPLPEMKKGDDLYQHNVMCRDAYAVETAKLRSCQSYINTILKKQ